MYNLTEKKRKELRNNQDLLLASYLADSGLTREQAIQHELKVCSQIPVLIKDWIVNIYPEHERIVCDLLDYKKL